MFVSETVYRVIVYACTTDPKLLGNYTVFGGLCSREIYTRPTVRVNARYSFVIIKITDNTTSGHTRWNLTTPSYTSPRLGRSNHMGFPYFSVVNSFKFFAVYRSWYFRIARQKRLLLIDPSVVHRQIIIIIIIIICLPNLELYDRTLKCRVVESNKLRIRTKNAI